VSGAATRSAAAEKSSHEEMIMKAIVSAFLALSVLAGFAARASAVDENGMAVEQEDWHRNFGL
jgi:hypothetical protein